jgi:polysaccharide chain length determinant protein (PEP-CTERM system associated)
MGASALDLSVLAMGNIDIGFYISILKRRLHYILAIALAVLVIAVFVIRVLPPVYSATARILAEAPQIPQELARSTVSIGGTAQLLILQQEMTTRDALLALAAKLHIYRDAKTKPADEDIVKDLRSRIKFDQVQLDIQNPAQGVTVYAVSFNASQPVLAAKVANEIVAMILAKNQSERTDRASSTLQFFDQKVSRLDADLRKLESAILKFKNENRETLPDSLDFRRRQQSSLQERLVSLEREESDLRTRRNGLIVTYTSTGQLSDSIPLSPEQQMLADLNRALAMQLAVFTEDSPNIKAIRARIAVLQKNLVAVRPIPEDTNVVTGGDKAPFGLELQLSDVDNRLQAVGKEKLSIARRIDDLTASIAATPASETVLNSLLRNRENIQTQYNAAIAQRAEASTGAQIEMRSDGERFSLLESAKPPTKAGGPARKMIFGVAGIAGLGLGLALVVLLELLNKTVRRPKDLTRLLQTQPLGTIPIVRTRHEVRAAKFRLGLAAFLSAGVMPASLILVHYYYMPLDLVFQKLMTGLVWTGTT